MRESTGTHQLCLSHPIVLLQSRSSCQSTRPKVHRFDLSLTLFDKASCRCSSWRQQITDNTMGKDSYLLAVDTLTAISLIWDLLVSRSRSNETAMEWKAST